MHGDDDEDSDYFNSKINNKNKDTVGVIYLLIYYCSF